VATTYNILQLTATYCNILQQHTTTHCNTLQQHYGGESGAAGVALLGGVTTCCNTLQHPATTTHCNTLQITATHCNSTTAASQGRQWYRCRAVSTRWYCVKFYVTSETQSARSRTRVRTQSPKLPRPTTTHCTTLQHTATQV